MATAVYVCVCVRTSAAAPAHASFASPCDTTRCSTVQVLQSTSLRELQLSELQSRPVLGCLPTLTRLDIGMELNPTRDTPCWEGLTALTALEVRHFSAFQ